MFTSLLSSLFHNPFDCVDQVNNLLGNLEDMEEEGICSCKLSREIVDFIDGCIWLRVLYPYRDTAEALTKRICTVPTTSGRPIGQRLETEKGHA